MQSPSLIFALFMLGAIPLLMVLSNHEVYFIIMGVLLLATSVRNIYLLSSMKKLNKKFVYDESQSSEHSDLDDDMELDMRKISTGTKIAKSLNIILFIFYCTLYTFNFIFSIISALLCLYHVNYIINCIRFYKIKKNIKLSTFRKIVFAIVNLLTVILIVIASINKFST